MNVDIAARADGFSITASVRTTGPTGVEMEALTAVSVAALTLYDMIKAVDKTMEIGPIRLLEKLPHGWGIMSDDVAAGYYTGLILAIVRLVVPLG